MLTLACSGTYWHLACRWSPGRWTTNRRRRLASSRPGAGFHRWFQGVRLRNRRSPYLRDSRQLYVAERLLPSLSDPAGNEVRFKNIMFPDPPFETQWHILSANFSAFTDNHHVFLWEWELLQHRDFRQVLPELYHCWSWTSNFHVPEIRVTSQSVLKSAELSIGSFKRESYCLLGTKNHRFELPSAWWADDPV